MIVKNTSSCNSFSKKITPRKRAKNTPIMEYIRNLIWNGSYGLKKKWLSSINSCNRSLSNGWFKIIPAWRFVEHFAGENLLYGCGNPWNTRHALGMIDIDALGHRAAKKARDAGLPIPPTPAGAVEGALAAARVVDDLFKEQRLLSSCRIFWEPSSNGIGQSGYITFHGKHKRESYELLEVFLRQQLQPLIGSKIEDIEVKGKPPEMEDVVLNGRTIGQQCVTLGTLCKLPSTATLEDLKRLPKLSIEDLQSLPVVEPEAKPEAKPKAKPEIKPSSTYHDPAELVFPGGSVDVCSFTYGMLERLDTYRQQAQHLIKRHPSLVRKVRSKIIDVEKDVPIFLMTLRFFALDPNKEDSMPGDRIYEFWNMLYHADHVSRAPAFERIKAIRDWLSGLSLLDWRDHTFEPPTFSEKKADRQQMDSIGGVRSIKDFAKSKGRCCKWSLSQHFIDWLDSSAQHTPSLITNEITPIVPQAIYVVGKREPYDEFRLVGEEIAQEWTSRLAA